MVAGSLTYETKLNTKGFQDGINDINNKTQAGGTKMKSIIGALGIAKLVQTGINMITSSLDSAIDRLDTMNNFPKVMSNLGISASDSQKAIDKLSEGLKGIPTRLDAGALAVQRFTSKNMDVQKSTDIFLALNNAILAGGASTQIQESALEQLSQAYSKGKMDMMEWRTLQQAMPAQLKQVADTMGLTVNELGEMMRQGEDTDKVMDQFLDTIIDLNENGGKNIIAFKDQAKNATDGIRTNITNMKTAISRGTASIIDAVNKMLKKVNINGIGDLISKVGKKAEDVLKNIAKFIEKLPLEAMLKVLKKLLPVVEAVVVAFVAYQVALKAISIINIAQSIMSTVSAFISLIPAITSAKDAMTLLNMVFNLNPMALVITAVAGLTTGFALLVNSIGKATGEVKKTNEVLSNYKTTMAEAKKEKEEYLKTNMGEINNYQSLAKELDNLVDENGKVKEGYEERAKFIVTTLNDALGTEITMTDGVISNYKEVKKSIEDVIKTKRAQVLLEAEEKEYNKALDQRATLEEQLANQTKDVKEKLDAKHKVEKEIMKTYGLTNKELQDLITNQTGLNNTYGITSSQYDDIYKKIANVDEKYRESRGVLTELRDEYSKNELKIADYQIALQNLEEGNYEAVLKMYEDTANFQGKTNEETKKNYDMAILAQNQYLKDLEANRNNYTDEEYNALKSAGEAKLKEYEDQRKKYTSTIKTGQDEATKEVEKGTTDQINTIKSKKSDHNKAGKDNIEEYKKGLNSKKLEINQTGLSLAGQGVSGLNSKNGEAYGAGQNVSSGFASGMSSLGSLVRSSATSIAQQALNAIKETADIHSPSKETKKLGKYFDEGFKEGIEENSKDVYNEVENMTEEILDKMENAVNLETGKMSFNGTAGSVSQILSANAQFEGTIPLRVDLDGEKIYDNQQKITARKNLQYGGVR